MSETLPASGRAPPVTPVVGTRKGEEGLRQEGYTRIDNRFFTHFASRIGALAVAVYVVLCRYADSATGRCYPSIRTLAKVLSLSQPTVLKALARLEKEGLIKVERRRTKGGKREVNVYTLLRIDDAQRALAPVLNDVEHRAKGGLVEQDLINKNQENKREGAPTGQPPVDAHGREAGLDHPAVLAYRETFKLTPTEVQRAEIARVVTDVAVWREVLRNWQLANYSMQNVPGMLDRYRKETCERSGGNGRYATGGRSGFRSNGMYDRRESRPPETPEETARLDAEWEALVRQSRGRSGDTSSG